VSVVDTELTPVEPAINHSLTRRALWLLGATVFVATCFLSQPVTGWNSNSRLDLVFAVVDHSRLTIDEYQATKPFDTGDKALFKGHYYSDKTIGVSVVALPMYAAIRGVSKVLDVHPSFQLVQYLLTRWAVSLPAAVAAMLLASLLVRLGAIPRRAILVTAGVFFGSMLFGYSTVFFPYLNGVAACLGALTIVLSPPLTLKRAAWVGLLLGSALIFDLTFVIAVAVIGVLLLRALRGSGVGRAAALLATSATAAALPVAGFTIYSMVIFGKPTIPYQYEASTFFRDNMSRGVMGVTTPKLDVMWFLSFHAYRGILFWSPWLLPLIACCIWLIKNDKRMRPIAIASIATFVGYFIFNSAYYEWWGGATMGPRLMIPMFAVVPLGLVAVCRSDCPRWLRYWVTAALALAVALCLPVAMIDPQTKQGNQRGLLMGIREGVHLRVVQIEVLKDFYRLFWLNIKPVAGIPIVFSFIACMVVIAGGTGFAYYTARRVEVAS
jgi:hypothetical protein